MRNGSNLLYAFAFFDPLKSCKLLQSHYEHPMKRLAFRNEERLRFNSVGLFSEPSHFTSASPPTSRDLRASPRVCHRKSLEMMTFLTRLQSSFAFTHLRKRLACQLIWLRWNMALIARSTDATCRNGAKDTLISSEYSESLVLGSMITIYTASNTSLNGASSYAPVLELGR